MPELTVKVPLAGREIEVRQPTEAALVVLARITRALPTGKIENAEELPPGVREKLIRDLGTIGKTLESVIVQETDKLWLDDAMIDGDVTAEEAFQLITKASEKFNGKTTPAKKATASVRRVSGRAR